MNTARETIYTALFALIVSSSSYTTTSRRMRLINELQPSQLPALYMSQVAEETIAARPHPPKYILRVDFAIYALNPNEQDSAAPQLNALIDAAEAALAPDPVTGVQSLGGLVSHCFINGKTEIFEGNLGNRAAAVIPVEILTT
jgi:hypothetical protein